MHPSVSFPLGAGRLIPHQRLPQNNPLGLGVLGLGVRCDQRGDDHIRLHGVPDSGLFGDKDTNSVVLGNAMSIAGVAIALLAPVMVGLRSDAGGAPAVSGSA